MLTIRLSRIGKKKKPMYRLIVSENARTPRGRALEILGSYNPFTKELAVNKERTVHWLGKGAQMSPTVNNLLLEKNIIKGTKRKASKTPSKILVKRNEEEAKKKESAAAKESDTEKKEEKEKKEGEESASSEGSGVTMEEKNITETQEAEKQENEKTEEKKTEEAVPDQARDDKTEEEKEEK